jgi:hypothetical protein
LFKFFCVSPVPAGTKQTMTCWMAQVARAIRPEHIKNKYL